MAKRYKTTVETENKTMLEGVDRQPAGFTIWMKKYRKEAQRNTTEEKAKLCKIWMKIYRTEAHRNTSEQKAKLCKRSRRTTAGSPINAQVAELTRPKTIPALFRRNNCNNQFETFLKRSLEQFSTNPSTNSKPLTI